MQSWDIRFTWMMESKLRNVFILVKGCKSDDKVSRKKNFVLVLKNDTLFLFEIFLATLLRPITSSQIQWSTYSLWIFKKYFAASPEMNQRFGFADRKTRSTQKFYFNLCSWIRFSSHIRWLTKQIRWDKIIFYCSVLFIIFEMLNLGWSGECAERGGRAARSHQAQFGWKDLCQNEEWKGTQGEAQCKHIKSFWRLSCRALFGIEFNAKNI